MIGRKILNIGTDIGGFSSSMDRDNHDRVTCDCVLQWSFPLTFRRTRVWRLNPNAAVMLSGYVPAKKYKNLLELDDIQHRKTSDVYCVLARQYKNGVETNSIAILNKPAEDGVAEELFFGTPDAAMKLLPTPEGLQTIINRYVSAKKMLADCEVYLAKKEADRKRAEAIDDRDNQSDAIAEHLRQMLLEQKVEDENGDTNEHKNIIDFSTGRPV